MLPREDDLPTDQPHYFDPPASDDVPPSRPSWRGRAEEVPTEAAPPAEHLLIDPTKPPPALTAGPSVGSILQGLKRRWWLALGIGLVLGLVASAGAYVFLEPPYNAFAQFRVATVAPGVFGEAVDSPKHRNEYMAYQRLQVAYIKDRHVLNTALTQPEVKSLALVKEQPDPLLWLEEQIRVEFQETSEVMTIGMTSPDAEAAKAIVNAVREAYFAEVVERERKSRDEKVARLEKIVDTAVTELNKKRDLYNQMADDFGSDDSKVIAQKLLNLNNELSTKRQQLITMQFEMKKAEAQLKMFEDRGPPKPEPMAEPMGPNPTPSDQPVIGERALNDAVARDPLVRQAMAEFRVAETKWNSAKKHLHPWEPEYSQLRDRYARAEANLEKEKAEARAAVIAEATRLKAEQAAQAAAAGQPLNHPANSGIGYATTLEQARAELGALKRPIDELQAEVDDLKKETEKFNKRSAELERLRDEKNGESARLAGYKDQLEALRLEVRSGGPGRVTRFGEAGLQRRDTKRQIMGAGVVPLVVLAAVCFAVGWWESRARRINSADEVARGLGVRVVGAVPAFPRWGRKNEEAFEHLLTESIDSVRTMLLREADCSLVQVVMVTSAAAGEGKTTMASQLAGSLARAGRRTLLIDCDLRRPAAHQLFELPLSPGLSEVLLDEVHVAEATLATEIDGLWMIPAGEWDRDVIAALAKDRLGKVLEKLRQAYDFIILDSHPALSTTDSLLIGQNADAVLMAVMRDVSQAPKVYAAMQRLGSLQIRVLGAVVSGLPERAVLDATYACAAPAMR